MINVAARKDDGFVVTKDDSQITIDCLSIELFSNFRTPYMMKGRGGASISLTPEEFLTIVCEFIRYTLPDDVDVEFHKRQVGFEFSVVQDRWDEGKAGTLK
jgi:hypothetical protein